MSAAIEFELTDERAAQMARENWIAHGRKIFTKKFLLLMAGISVIGVAALLQDVSGWLLLLWTLAPALFAVMVVIWLAIFWWVPKAMLKKIAHLPHRTVTVELNEQQLKVRTAGEQLSVDWNNLQELKELPHYWMLCLKGGTEIPILKQAVPDDALALLRGKAARVTTYR